MPTAAILTIGTELLLGKLIDTNGAYLGEVLSSSGFDVRLRVSIGDHKGEVERWIRALLEEVELIVTTGGLGPTKDDLTRKEVAEALGVPLVFHSSLLKEIESIFVSRGFRMTENNRRQAYLPEGAVPISNPVGTAPAFLFRTKEGKVVVCLPGVPRELKYLMERKVLSLLRETFGLVGRVKRTRILKVCGLGESGVDQQIGDLMRTEGNPLVGVLASPGIIRILITAEGENEREVSQRIAEVEGEIRRRLGRLIFGVDAETLEGVVVEKLARMVRDLAVEDGATGGELIRMLLKAFEGAYRIEGYLQFARGARSRSFVETHPEALSLRVRPAVSDEKGLRAFTVAIRDGKEETQAHFRLGGPKREVETRLAILAVDQLRKWMEARLKKGDSRRQ